MKLDDILEKLVTIAGIIFVVCLQLFLRKTLCTPIVARMTETLKN